MHLRIERFDPEVDRRARFETYTVDASPTARVLDVLHELRDTCAPGLAFRRNCGHGACGSCAMRINNKNRLACRVLVRDCGPSIEIRPLPGFAVVRDLIVDMEPFFSRLSSIHPWLYGYAPPEGERRQSPRQVARFADTAQCILCGACTSACPVSWSCREYLGPAVLVAAHRFIFDSRDERTGWRLVHVGQADGVWRCRSAFSCSEACPRGIAVTRAVQEIRQALLYNGRGCL